MAIDVNFTESETPPSSADALNFRTRADAFVAYIAAFATKLIAFVLQLNNTEASINAKEASAVAAAAAAVASANYKGVFVQGTSNALFGESWSYGGASYRCAVNTSNNPSMEPASWVSTSMDAIIHAAPTKATPIDDDEFGFWDSVSGVLRKLSFLALYNALKARLDLVFSTINSPSFTGKITSTDTVVSATSGVYSAVANVITVVLTVASHTVAIGDIIKVSGITNAQASTGGSNVVFNGYMIVTAQTSTTITYQIDTLIGTVGSTALTGAVSFSHGGLYLDSIPKVKSGANYYPIQGATAWVNFDGTTTPPTIRDSFNVSAVIRTATGRFDIYFEEPMSNTNYSLAGHANWGNDSSIAGLLGSPLTHKTVNLVKVGTVRSDLLTDINLSSNSVLIFGGKN